jgi:hypothetical protein
MVSPTRFGSNSIQAMTFEMQAETLDADYFALGRLSKSNGNSSGEEILARADRMVASVGFAETNCH